LTSLDQSSDPGREKPPPRPRKDFKQRQRRSAAPTAFGAALTSLGIKQRSAAQWFRTSERNIRRWASGTRKTPPGIAVVIQLMLAGKIGPADVEQAAALTPVKTNGDAGPEPPASLRVVEPAPAPEPTVTDRAQTLAEKILALRDTCCRWPIGDPRRSEFCFCGRPAAAQPYCEDHARVAHMTRTSGSSPFRPSVKPARKLAAG